MTIEIRQMVIKSSIDNGAVKAGKKPADNAADEKASNDDCGGRCGGGPSGEERQRMRVMMTEEFERMRER